MVLAYPDMEPGELNKYSSVITKPKKQGAGQAQLYGTGMDDADMCAPQIGIMSNWFEGNPCNMHLNELQDMVREGVQAVGMKSMAFTAIGVSAGISNGTDGMAYSLQSRDLIADSYETVMLVAGGIGLTPFASALKSLIQFKLAEAVDPGKKSAIRPRHIYFYWLFQMADYEAFQWFAKLLSHLRRVYLAQKQSYLRHSTAPGTAAANSE